VGVTSAAVPADLDPIPRTVARQSFPNDIPADIPHQNVGIQIRPIDEAVAQPALRPKLRLLDDRK